MNRLIPVPALLAASLSIGCTTSEALTAADVAAVETMLADFRQAWLDNDPERIMGHLSDDFTLYVPGPTASTLRGKEPVHSYWFPSRDTLYRITKYQITDPQTHGSGRYAVAQGTSHLGWEMVVKDSVHLAATSKSEFVTVLRKEGNDWKLFRQIFVVRN